jgi:hypothetical protein
MSYTDTVSRIAQIQADIASVRTAFDPPAPANSSQTPSAPAASSTSTTTFADALAQAQATGAATPPGTAQDISGVAGTGVLGSTGALGTTGAMGSLGAAGSAQLPAAAQSMLTSGQQQFAARLAANTGLNPSVISAWLLAEESGGAAQSREAAGNNDWLNIGYTDSGTYGSSDSIWSNPITAADATAGWLKGQDTIPGYGRASAGVQAILRTAGQSPQAQVAALQQSGWASSGYPSLPSLLAQVGG